MPGGDRTGPLGAGPMTGWGRGFCGPRGAWSAGTGSPAGRGRGGGFGWGRGLRNRSWGAGPAGWGRGWAWRAAAPAWGVPPESDEDERQALARDAALLESELARVRARLDELGDHEAR